MLTESDIADIAAEVRGHPTPRSSVVSVLRLIQARHGFVSDEDLAQAAPLLGLSTDEMDEVATFYNLIFRRPVGRHVIHVCDSVSCWMLGGEAVAAHIAGRLGIRMGETTPDGLFTLLPIVCLGACDHAPAMMVDGKLHGDLTPERIDQVLASAVTGVEVPG